MQTQREQVAELMAAMAKDQAAAMAELHSFMTGEDGVKFRDAAEAARQRTVPGSPFDRMLGVFLNAFSATVNIAEKGAQAAS